MPFLAHLEELRWRVIKCLSAVIIAAIGVYVVQGRVLHFFLTVPLRGIEPQPQIIFTTPGEAFMAGLKLSGFCGLIIAAPFVIYQVWRFVAPGLFHTERKHTLSVIILSALSFLGGIVFALWAMPQALRFLVRFGAGSAAPFFTISSYLSFVVRLTLAFGLVFQLPAVSVVLTRAGVITHRTLLSHWRIAVVLVFVIAAVITPPDVVSQLLMALPLLVLFFLSILLSMFAGWR